MRQGKEEVDDDVAAASAAATAASDDYEDRWMKDSGRRWYRKGRSKSRGESCNIFSEGFL